MMKGTWKRWVFGTVLLSIATCGLLLWQTPVLVRLPFKKAYVMHRESQLNVFVNGSYYPESTVYVSALSSTGWPSLITLDFPQQVPGYTKLMILPKEGEVGDSNEGRDCFQNLGRWLICADNTGCNNLYSGKAFEGEPHFEKGSNYLRFRLPEEYKAFPGAVIEVRRAEKLSGLRTTVPEVSSARRGLRQAFYPALRGRQSACLR